MATYIQEEEDFRVKFNQRLKFFISNYKNSYKDTQNIKEAMLYGALIGDPKRIRPLLVYGVAKSLGTNIEKVMPLAIAVEVIHCYSLIHDDLPAMDDDDMRRGMPSCHNKFGEANAILTGNIMQVIAFDSIIQEKQYAADQKEYILSLLIKTSCDIVYGQALDLRGEEEELSLDKIQLMHKLKCGALIRTAMQLGAFDSLDISGGSDGFIEKIISAGDKIGLAFQIRDDIMDIQEEGKDSTNHCKSTYPGIAGIDGSFSELKQLHKGALNDISNLDGDTSFLQYLFGIMTDIPQEESIRANS